MNKVNLVLLIEDSPVDLFIHKEVIIRSGLATTIKSSTTAADAINYLATLKEESIHPDIIFLDIRMPNMDGFEFLEAFEALPEVAKKGIKIVMLSSSIDDRDLTRARLNPHVLAFIPKPLTAEKLQELWE
ncbi:MAG: response regulator [Bacteroidia bacterium]